MKAFPLGPPRNRRLLPRIACRALVVLLVLPPAGATGGQALDEKVTVVNVEVPVRVFREGAPVDGLNKGDFRLYEDDVPQEINGFYLRRKKMKVQRVALEAGREGEALPPRYFVMAFRILEYTQPMKRALDYFFSDVLREQDRLLVLANDRTVPLDRDLWQVQRREILDQILREEAARARQELDAYFQRVSQDIDQNHLRQLLDNDANFTVAPLINFLDRYLEVWREFKAKYLVPDLDRFYNFAQHLERIQGEKWVLNFYQFGMFPKMRIGGRLRRQIDDIVARLDGGGGSVSQFARVISRQLDTIDRELNIAHEFPAEEIGKMLTGVDITYHCLISGVEREGLSEDMETKRVASDLERTLREITSRSGGMVVLSGDIGSALHAIVEKEDVYYVLTFAPKNPGRLGRITVHARGAGLRLLYDDKQRSGTIARYVQGRRLGDPTVRLHDLAFSRGKLHCIISDFRVQEQGGRTTARLTVVLRIRDGAGALVYDRGRAIDARERHVVLDVGCEWLKPGRYAFLLEVHDQLSGRTAMEVLAVEI